MRVILIAHSMIVNDIPDYIPQFNITDDDVSMLDELAEEAGRLCYLSWDRPNEKTATNEGYLDNILNKQHFSVLEHASATFYIDGVSRNFTHELIRHRHLSFSEVSQRYVDVSSFNEIIAPARQNNLPKSIELGTLKVKQYNHIVETLRQDGASLKEARQAARYILPSGLETKILVTGNMRAWRDVLTKRLSPQADKEFQLVAKEILKHLKEISPNCFQDFE